MCSPAPSAVTLGFADSLALELPLPPRHSQQWNKWAFGGNPQQWLWRPLCWPETQESLSWNQISQPKWSGYCCCFVLFWTEALICSTSPGPKLVTCYLCKLLETLFTTESLAALDQSIDSAKRNHGYKTAKQSRRRKASTTFQRVALRGERVCQGP